MALSFIQSKNAPASFLCKEYASVGGGVRRYFMKVPPYWPSFAVRCELPKSKGSSFRNGSPTISPASTCAARYGNKGLQKHRNYLIRDTYTYIHLSESTGKTQNLNLIRVYLPLVNSGVSSPVMNPKSRDTSKMVCLSSLAAAQTSFM